MHFIFAISWENSSAWWILLCLIISAVYAWLMYRRPASFNKNLGYVLAVLRFLAVSCICLLLLSVFVRSTNYEPQKPLVLVALDNSSSVKKFNPKTVNLKQVVARLSDLEKTLGDKYDVRLYNFGKDLANGLNGNFTGKQTNVSAALHQLNDRFVNQNIGAIILATDGLYNEGSDPLYEVKNTRSPVYTIGLGDTTTRRDLLISNINYNKTALLGNDFEVEVSAEAYLSKGQNMVLNVYDDGMRVLSDVVKITTDNFNKNLKLKLNAAKKGVHKFTFNIAPINNEASLQNNTETIYIDVIDARQKILLIYDSPNPDIGAIKQSVESNSNFQLKAINTADIATVNPAVYTLLILYQAGGPGNLQLQKLIDNSHLPLWVIAGAQTDPGELNRLQNLVKLVITRIDNQEVFASQQPGFSAFTLSDSALKKIAEFPPLIAAFGNYTSGSGTSVLFKQKIGNISTNFPLMAFGENNNRRQAVLLGEGLWRWQLAEYERYGSHYAVDELVQQTVQYLTANATRKRFRVYPAKNTFNEGEDLIFNAELYNEALVLTNTPEVKLDLQNSAGKKYSYQFSRKGQSYQLVAGELPEGDYTYNAITQLGKQQFTATGKISITAADIEERQSRANHQLLKHISKISGGEFLLPGQVDKLAELIRKNDNIKTILNENKHYAEPIDLKWIFALILVILSAEWFLRKREGDV